MIPGILYSPVVEERSSNSFSSRLLFPISSVFVFLSCWNVDLTDNSLLKCACIQNRHKMIEVYNKQSLKAIQQHVSSLNVQLTKHRLVSVSPGLCENRVVLSFAFWYCQCATVLKKSHLHFGTFNNKQVWALEGTAVQLSVSKSVLCLPW